MELKKQLCPICKTNNLILREKEIKIAYFGRTLIFSMSCEKCKYNKTDVESVEKKGPCKITFVIKDNKDLNVKVVKSSEATIKLPQLKMSVTPGIGSNGYITTVEGVVNRFYNILEHQRNNAENKETKKRVKRLLKRLWKVKLGEESLKIIIEDPSGNSAIISKEAVIKRL